jgi:hypothetical protein
VSPTVPFDILLSFIFGAGIALACAPQVKGAGSAVLNPCFLGAVLFEIFFFLPFGIYLYCFYTDWSWMYFINPAQLAPRTVKILGFAAMIGYLAALIAGFQVAQFLVRRRLEKTGWAMLGAALLALAVFSLLTINRLMNIGSYNAYFADQATLLVQHRVGYLTALVGIIMAGALFFMIRTFRAVPGRG